ncbi:MAG: selenium cofactor biosynthesis protein YqeC [Eubacteriales bacterium]|jgi:probable selenium-dependent hydroxylase accessory protein YqeC
MDCARLTAQGCCTCDSLWQALELPEEGACLVGGGGKTTLLYRLGWERHRQTGRVLLTTTTHIWRPEGYQVTGLEEPEKLRWEKGPVVAGLPAAAGKLGPLLQERRRAAQELGCTILVEADGSRGLPCKAPAAHEPALWPASPAVIVLLGLDGLEGPIGEVCHRPERVCALLGKTPDQWLSPAEAAALLTHPLGGRKGVEDRLFRVVLNKADTPGRRAAAEEIAVQLRQRGVEWCVRTAFTEEERDELVRGIG